MRRGHDVLSRAKVREHLSEREPDLCWLNCSGGSSSDRSAHGRMQRLVGCTSRRRGVAGKGEEEANWHGTASTALSEGVIFDLTTGGRSVCFLFIYSL